MGPAYKSFHKILKLNKYIFRTKTKILNQYKFNVFQSSFRLDDHSKAAEASDAVDNLRYIGRNDQNLKK